MDRSIEIAAGFRYVMQPSKSETIMEQGVCSAMAWNKLASSIPGCVRLRVDRVDFVTGFLRTALLRAVALGAVVLRAGVDLAIVALGNKRGGFKRGR